MNDVDIYISRFDLEVQHRLMIIRTITKELVPDADERVYFGVPTIKVNGLDVLHYAAYKNHISLIVGYDLAEYLMKHFPQYLYTKATVKFPHKNDLPIEFIKNVYEMILQYRR